MVESEEVQEEKNKRNRKHSVAGELQHLRPALLQLRFPQETSDSVVPLQLGLGQATVPSHDHGSADVGQPRAQGLFREENSRAEYAERGSGEDGLAESGNQAALHFLFPQLSVLRADERHHQDSSGV